jgi:thiol-disulfide isomerase/thioredoxin
VRAALLLALGCLLALTGCTSLQGAGDKGFVTGDGRVTRLAVADRESPVELRGEDLDGRPLALSDFRGNPVVVVVWGSWCTPCRAEAPDVVAAAEELEGEAETVGLNIRDPSPAQAQAFVRTFEVPYRSLYSPDGKAMLPFQGVLTPNSIPSFVVLDADGRVAASIIGALPSTDTLVELTRDVAGRTDGAAHG